MKGIFRDSFISQKDDRKGLNTLFVKISTLTSEKMQISGIIGVKS